MNKYTFIFEYQGGTYISQYKAKKMQKAISIWANNLDFIFSDKKIKIIQNKINNELYIPVQVRDVENVWCTSFTILRSLLLLNIIETV